MLGGYSVYGLTPGGWCLGPYLFDMKTKYTVFGRLFDFTKFVNEFTVHLLIVQKNAFKITYSSSHRVCTQIGWPYSSGLLHVRTLCLGGEPVIDGR